MANTGVNSRHITTLLKAEFIPGTSNIYSSSAQSGKSGSRVNKDDIVLAPQPTDSVNDPLNWCRRKKLLNFLLLAAITGFTAATSNDASATQLSLNNLFDISYKVTNSGAGILFITIGWTTFLLTPVASLYGRKISYVLCIFVGLLGAVWFALGKTPSDRIWSQIFVGASEACAEAHVQLSLTDMYFQHQLGSVLMVYILATSVGTYFGPLIAGFIVKGAGYEWVGWIAAFVSGGLLVAIVFGMNETMFDRKGWKAAEDKAGVEDKVEGGVKVGVKAEDKADTKYSETPQRPESLSAKSSAAKSHENNDLELSQPPEASRSDPKYSYWKLVALITKAPNVVGSGFTQYLRRLLLLFRVFLFPPMLFSGLVWGMQDALLTFYLTVENDKYYEPPYNFGDTRVALLNVPCLIGAVIGCVYAGVLSDWFTLWMAKRNGGVHEAEYRLYFLVLPAVLTPLGLLLFAIGTDQKWAWFPTYFGLVLIGVGFGSSGDVSMGYLMDAYPDMVIEMMAGVSVVNNMYGCVFSFACSYWLADMGNTSTFVVLAVLTLFIMGGCIPFIVYGKRIRRWTKPWYLNYCERRDSMEGI